MPVARNHLRRPGRHPCAPQLRPHNGPVQDWIELKDLIAASFGLDRGTLRVIASVPLHFLLALMMRRPLTSSLPWLILLILALANEATNGFSDENLEDWELAASLRDLLLTMVLPTFLVFACRIRVLHPSLREAQRSVQLVPVRAPRGEPIIDAEFEEIVDPGRGARPAQAD